MHTRTGGTAYTLFADSTAATSSSNGETRFIDMDNLNSSSFIERMLVLRNLGCGTLESSVVQAKVLQALRGFFGLLLYAA